MARHSSFDPFPEPPARVLHIGAGSASELQGWLESGAERIVLVEADPDIAARLTAAAKSRPQVEVVEAAISANTRSRPFYRMNFPDLNALRKPTGLRSLFPGLQILSQEPVRPLGPVKLIESLGIAEKGPNLLVIEAPGESLGILRALDKAGFLTLFDMVRIQEGREVLYNHAPTILDVQGFLSDTGFLTGIEQEPADPDRPHVFAWLDRAALAREARISDLEDRASRLQQELEAATARAASLEAAREDERQARAAAESRAAELAQECEQAGEQLRREEEARSAIEARISDLEDRASRLQQELEAATARAASLEAAREDERQARAAAESRAAELAQECEQLRTESENRLAQLQHAWSKVEEGQADLKVAQQNLAMALRMQSLRESDLRELQERHAGLLDRKAAQDRLLQKLTTSLASAAEYLQSLDGLPAPDLTENLVAGTAAEPRKPAFPRSRHSQSPSSDD